MKKFLYMAVAAIAALSSCSDNDIVSEESGKGDNNGPVFTATIEGDEESGNASAKGTTRTTLAEGSSKGKKMVNWSNGDSISINGKKYSTTSTTNTATFTAVAEGAEKVDGKYIAVYPTKVTVTDYATNTINLPYWQYYDTKTNGIKSVPMVAVSTSTNLEFKNVCAVLAIKVASGTVKRILVKADNKNLSGNFELNTNTYRLTALAGKNTVGLYCSKAVTANNTTFYIAIPAQEYSSLQIYIAADDKNYKEVMATKVPAGLGTLVRNKIYEIEYKTNAVQLWENGPYFATENVGGTNEYRWGAELPTGSVGYNSGSYDKEHDTAYKNWGSAWRMPTKSEFEALISNSTITYSSNGTEGYTFTSTTSGYGSIFLPAQTSTQATLYWSSTADPDNSSNAYAFSLKKSSTTSIPIKTTITSELKSYSRGGTLPVRAVIATPAAAPDPNLLSGKFSVSASKTVQFTKGNLYWDGKTYKFEEHQYDYPTEWSTTHVGHFFWTSWTNYSSGIAIYMPYAGVYDVKERHADDEFWCGENHKLMVRGTENLYALSGDEWVYLINTRSNASSLCKRGVNVAGKGYCLIIAPDGYKSAIKTTYSADEWATAEASGLVCLPPAGYFFSSIHDGSAYGYYWSSSPYSDYYIDGAYGFYFGPQEITTGLISIRKKCFSLRLVK